ESSLLTHSLRDQRPQSRRPRSQVSDASEDESPDPAYGQAARGDTRLRQAPGLLTAATTKPWGPWTHGSRRRHEHEVDESKDEESQASKLKKLLKAAAEHEKELSKLTGAVNSLLFSGKDKVEDGAADEAEPRYQSITVKDSIIYGNIIGGNSDSSSRNVIWRHDVKMPMKKDFEWRHDVNMPIGNTKKSIDEKSIDVSSGNAQWRHEVFMPIGNTKKSVDVSANGTNIRHRVDTDL
ncbi:unnamed protein product, partial [Symbiodinium pilosum]